MCSLDKKILANIKSVKKGGIALVRRAILTVVTKCIYDLPEKIFFHDLAYLCTFGVQNIEL
jgi:hypothetical protein